MPNRPAIRRRSAAARSLAMRLIAGVLTSTSWAHAHKPLADEFSALEWLREQLTPLARHDRLVRELMCVLDPEEPCRPWNRPKSTKAELDRLAACAQAFKAPVKRMVRRGRRP